MADINYPNKQVAVNPLFPSANEKWSASNANEVKAAVNTKQDKDYVNPVTNASARTITSRLAQELWVEDFRATGDTDVTVWKKAITAMQTERKPLYVADRAYNFNTHIIVGEGYWNVVGHDTVINNTSTQYPRIDSSTLSDLTYPSLTDPAVLRGCAFYFTTTIYYSEFKNIIFTGFRFAIAFYQSHNSPYFEKCAFLGCNVGVICYQGCQNYYYKDCEATDSGVMHISSAVCFPQGSPLSMGDNFYTDGFQIDNPINAFGRAQIQASFDTWFIASILRPAVDSYTVGNINKYPFDANHLYSQPTGRVIFIPMRTDRPIHGFTVKIMTVIGRIPRGFALVNGAIVSLFIGPTQAEGAWDVTPDTSIGLYTLGAASSGSVDYTRINPSVLTHPFIVWTNVPYPTKDKFLDKVISAYQDNLVKNKLRDAQNINYAQPWLVGGVEVLKDRDYYIPILEATVFSQPNSTTLDLTCDPEKLFPLLQAGDIIQLGANAFKLPVNFTAFKRDSDIRFIDLGALLPEEDISQYADKSAGVYRSIYNHTESAESYVKNIKEYPYRRKVIITNSGNGFIDLGGNLSDDAPFIPITGLQLSQTDVLIVEVGQPIILTGATFSSTGGVYKITKTGTDFTSYAGKVALIFGNHKYENPYL